jgi:hypothetical protein
VWVSEANVVGPQKHPVTEEPGELEAIHIGLRHITHTKHDAM